MIPLNNINTTVYSITLWFLIYIVKMVRPQIDLNPYKDEITALFYQQQTTETICIELAQRYSINISHSTLVRRLREWGLHWLPPKTINNKALCERIQSLVRDNLSDAEIQPYTERGSKSPRTL